MEAANEMSSLTNWLAYKCTIVFGELRLKMFFEELEII